MEDDRGDAPLRYELESDDEFDTPPCHLEVHGDVPLRRSWTVLLGTTGAACLALARGARPVTAHIRVDGSVVAYVHAAQSEAPSCVLYLPWADGLRPETAAAVARHVATLEPRALGIVQAYEPRLYFAREAGAPCVRMLSYAPHGMEIPAPWPRLSDPQIQAWTAPNTVSGVGAGLLAQALYAHTPACLYFVPSSHVPPHARSAPAPAAMGPAWEAYSLADARARVQKLLAAQDGPSAERVVALLGDGAQDTPRGLDLLHVALWALAGTRAAPGTLGDGSMYM